MPNKVKTVRRVVTYALVATTAVFTSYPAQAGNWGVGMGLTAYQPPIEGVDTTFYPLPFIYYEGERLSLNLGSVSYRLINTESFQFAVLGQARFQQYDPDDSDALKGMDKRDISIDVGGSATLVDSWGIAALTIVTDASDKHNGQEVSLAYSVPFFGKEWLLKPTLGVRWQSDDLVDYYYGVRSSEARQNRPTYQGNSAFSSFAGLEVAYMLTRHWILFGDATYAYLGKDIRDSPIVGQSYEASGSLGFLYEF